MKPLLLFVLTIALLLSCSSDEELVIPPEDIPNSDFILFSKDEKGYNELYRYDFKEETLLLSDPNYDYWWPKVSPDKSKILLYRSPVDSNKNHDNYPEADLMVMDIDGSNQRVLIEKGKYNWAAQGVCRWNKDGNKILMGAEQVTPSGNQWRLVITDKEGNNPKKLSDWWIIDPNFSVDNSEVVFIAFPENNLTFDLTKLELHKADFDTVNDTITNITRLTNNDTRDHDPSYSPDGSKIVFSAGNADYSNVDIAIHDTNLKSESDLVDDNGSNGGSMCWSEDGATIYFHSLNLTAHPFQIKKVEIDSKEVTTLLKSSPADFGYFHPESY